MHGLLIAVLLAEASVLAAGLALLVGHTAYRHAWAIWLRPRLHATRAIMARALAGEEHTPAPPRLPPVQTMRLLARATRSVDVTSRSRLRSLPAYSGLMSRARRWCADRHWARRLKGVRLMMILGAGEDTVPPLLDDPRAEVRSAAAAWTVQHPTTARISRIVSMLDDDALSCRLTAQAALIRLGRHAVAPVAAHLARPAPAALASTLTVASRLNAPALQDPALAHRAHPDPAVRTAVAELLASLGGGEAVGTLEKFLADPAATVRTAAAAGLGALSHWPSAPLLGDRLGDQAWEVRRAAGLALSNLRGPGRLYLQRSLHSTDPFAADMARQVLDLPGYAIPGLQVH